MARRASAEMKQGRRSMTAIRARAVADLWCSGLFRRRRWCFGAQGPRVGDTCDERRRGEPRGAFAGDEEIQVACNGVAARNFVGNGASAWMKSCGACTGAERVRAGARARVL
jgi:hypothetical protein